MAKSSYEWLEASESLVGSLKPGAAIALRVEDACVGGVVIGNSEMPWFSLLPHASSPHSTVEFVVLLTSAVLLLGAVL